MIKYVENSEQLSACVADLLTRKVLGVDTETSGLDPLEESLLLISIGNAQVQYVIDVYKVNNDIKKLEEVLLDRNIQKVFHNAKFDLKFLKHRANLDVKHIRCTMINDQLLYAGRKISHSLKNALNRHLGIPMSKEAQKSFIGMKFGESFTKEQIDYSGADVAHLPQLSHHIEKIIYQRGMGDLMDLEMDTIHATCDLELNGIYLNKNRWLALKEEAEKEMLNAKSELDSFFEKVCESDMFGDVIINYNSPSQILPKLEQITGYSIPSTGVAVLKKIDHPVIEALLKYREHSKKVTTYGEEFLNTHVSKIDGRVHSDFIQLGADSGRYASRNPNMTNIPSQKEYRAAFTAQNPKYKMISADFSGQELRLLAHLSQEKNFIDAIEKGIDLHTNSASLIFGIDYDNVTKQQRTAAKSLTFGLIYGIGPKKLSDNLDISYNEAKTLMDKYYKTFPQIKLLLDDLVKKARATEVATSPLDGRQRDLKTFDWYDRKAVAHALNISKNLPFQGAGASVTKKALCNIKSQIEEKSLDAKLVNVIHDEIVVEAEESCAEELARIVEKEMIKAFNHFAPSVPMEVEAQIEECWVKG